MDTITATTARAIKSLYKLRQIEIYWTVFQEEELNNNRGEDRVRGHHGAASGHHAASAAGKRAGRTGWPQHVWALELKQ